MPQMGCTDDFVGYFRAIIKLPWLQVDCSEYRRLQRGRPIYCERLYQPFCGSDGKTYNNKCSFCKAVL
ncbi:ISK9 inhibitor, partial [Catharus fuscescens]|nr:ISK9 inhibitor [Catharus fuscescens]